MARPKPVIERDHVFDSIGLRSIFANHTMVDGFGPHRPSKNQHIQLKLKYRLSRSYCSVPGVSKFGKVSILTSSANHHSEGAIVAPQASGSARFNRLKAAAKVVSLRWAKFISKSIILVRSGSLAAGGTSC